MSTTSLDRYGKVLDVDDLMNRCMGNVDFACRVLQLLGERCATDIEGLEEAAARNDFEQIYHISHRLKGAFANASAKRMSHLADQVCVASQSRDEGESVSKTNALRDEWAEFVAMLDANSAQAV